MLNGSCYLLYPTKLMTSFQFIGSSGSFALTTWVDLKVVRLVLSAACVT
jgi:hypothetical protein